MEEIPKRRFWIVFLLDAVHVVVPILVAAGITIYIYHSHHTPEPPEEVCYHDYMKNYMQVCRPACENGFWSLPGMDACRPWLTCDDITGNLQVSEPIGKGLVKNVYLARWNNQKMAISTLNDEKYLPDFQHGLEMLKGFQPSRRVVQLIGFCNNSYLTQFHRYKSSESVQNVLSLPQFKKLNTLTQRFEMCIHYVQTLTFLHKSPLGTRVMCDTNDLYKTLNQYLLTDDLSIVVNDLDALPEVKDGNGIKCGPRQLTGDFVAPEQLWKGSGEFDDSKMPGYDEKIDIWRIPDVCLFFLGDFTGSSKLKFQTHKIHKNCKLEDPKKRPSAADILLEYDRVKKFLNINRYTEDNLKKDL